MNDIGFAIRMNQGADAKKFKFIYELMINEALEKNKDLKLVLGEPFLFKITNNTPELGIVYSQRLGLFGTDNSRSVVR